MQMEKYLTISSYPLLLMMTVFFESPLPHSRRQLLGTTEVKLMEAKIMVELKNDSEQKQWK